MTKQVATRAVKPLGKDALVKKVAENKIVLEAAKAALERIATKTKIVLIKNVAE